jgi:hypothetical protein
LIRYVHVDNVGLVWSAGVNEIATLAAFDADEFVDSLPANTEQSWRLIGTHQNINLILRLHQDLPNASVYLTTPQVVETRRLLSDARYSIFCAQQSALPKSLGGWHQLTENQASIYNLATYQRTESTVPLFEAVISKHKFCRVLNFIPNLYLRAVAELATYILDPRWFVDVKNPDRCSKLKKFLGISPGIVTKMLQGNTSTICYRCKLVHAAWYTKIAPSDLEKPNFFLHRILDARSASINGWLAAANKFVEFMFRAWLAELEHENNINDFDFFDPDLFFKGSELAAYREHAKSIN